jgi:transcriptional regulator with XRE-family HTH domain
MDPAEFVRRARSESRLSLRSLAKAAGVAISTVHRIEQGQMRPTVDTLQRIVEAAGMRLHIDVRHDYATSLVGLALAGRENIAEGDPHRLVAMAAEFVQRFRAADAATRRRMIAAEPPLTGDPRWDAFMGGIAEWVAVQAGDPVPAWAHSEDRYLQYGWWVTPMASMRAWEYAGAPASFQTRGVFLHRESLVNV